MPLYEYVCRDCQVRFERLQPMGSAAEAECPGCGCSAGRVLSVFASYARTEGGGLAPVSGGGCACGGAGGGCSLN